MATIHTFDVGNLWVPDFDAVRFLPGKTTGTPKGKYMAIVTMSVRDGQTGKKTQAGHSADGIITVEGLQRKWSENEAYQQQFASPELMIETMRNKLKAVWHNERVNNGGKMMSKGFFGTTSSPSNATVGLPQRIGVSNLSSLAAAAGDASLGTATINVTTNEYTAGGLARTGALTPASVTDPSALNGQLSFTLGASSPFTASTTETAYGAGIFDNTTAAFNMFAEASFTAASMVNLDTLTITWTVSN